MSIPILKECKTHGLTEFYKFKRTDNNTCRYICKKCKNERQNKQKNERKIKAVEYLGGKCSICGYNKSFKSLCFHHIKNKKYNISHIITNNWNFLKEELDKCVLLCLNCHGELHFRKHKNQSYVTKSQNKRKDLLFELYDSKCFICNNKNISHMTFHHINKKEKNFNLSSIQSLENHIIESKKCIMLCYNCHGEIHGAS